MREPVPPALKRFIWDIQSIVELAESEREVLVIGRDLMARLVAQDDWLAAPFAGTGGQAWQHFQLYTDALERFTVTSTVLAPGKALPIWPQPVWDITGGLRGTVGRRRFSVSETAPPQPKAGDRLLNPSETDVFSPASGDAVQIYNARTDCDAICIHVYGGDIGKSARRTLTPNGEMQELAGGYANPEDWPAYDIYAIQTEIRD